MRDAGDLCRREGIAFIPVVAESLGGATPHCSGPAEAAGQGGGYEDILIKVSMTLMKGLSAMVLNRT